MDARLRTFILEIMDLRLRHARRRVDETIDAVLPTNFGTPEPKPSARVSKVLREFRAAYAETQSRMIQEILSQTKSAKALALLREALEDFCSAFAERLPFIVCFPYSNPQTEEDETLLREAWSDLQLIVSDLRLELRISSTGFALEPEVPERRPVPKAELRQFVQSLVNGDPKFISESRIVDLARTHFSNHQISRSMVREFTKGRRRGRPRTRD